MKSKNFLSKLWSRVAGSQRNDVEFDRRLTVGSPSGFTINWTLIWGQATVGTTMWAENFSGYSANNVPSGSVAYSHTGTTVYNNGSVSYTSVNGTKTSGKTNGGVTKIYEENSAGGTSPEILVGKRGSGPGVPGYFQVTGIPNGGATELTLTYTQNAKSLTVSISGTGYSLSGTGDDSSGSHEITITVGSASTFGLTFTAAGDNVRLDNLSVTVKTTGGSTKTLSSLAITTDPTTKKYLVGDTFSKTGAVVTATYSDETTADVSASATWTPTTGLVAGSNTMTASYTEGGVTKTATTTVTAYSVTVQKQDEDGTTIADAGVTASATGRTLSASGGSTKYVFKQWKFGTASGTSIASETSASTSLTGTPSAAVTVIAEFYKPVIVTWMVNGSEHATTQVVSGGHPVFPSVPSSCDAKKVFVGWTETNIGSTPTDVAPTFITTATTISANKTYYAVFAKRGRFDRVTGPSSLAAGQELVIVSNKFSTAITTGIGYASQPTEDADTLTSATTTEAMIWLLTGNSTDGWRITKPGDGYLLGAASSPSSNNSTTATLTANNTYSTWGIGQNTSTTNVLYISNKATATCALEASSATANWVVYNSSSYNSNQYCALRVYASTLSKFITTCCATNVSLSHNSPEHGTIAFGSTSVATCGGDQDVSLTITPDAGYQLATYSVATGSGKVATKNDPGISLNNNSNAVQNKTLTFASGVNGAYEVTASFTKMAPTACVWKYNGAAIPNPINLYVGQTAQLDATYTPSGLANSQQDYTVTKSANLTQTSKTYSSPDVHYTFRADAAMDDGTVTLTNKINTSLSTTVHVHVDELPRVHFVDLVHGKEFADVVATISDNALNPNKTMKTSVDWTTPNANDCEEQHLHLAGWILSTWADANPDATHSEIAGAGATNFYAPGAAINVLTNNGNTYYAVWAKEE